MQVRRRVQEILGRQRLAVLVLPLLTAAASAAPVSDMQRQDYNEYCASCHGPMGRGDGPVAAELKKRPADLTQLAKNNNGQFPYTRVRAIIDGRGQALGIHGPAEMPVWGQRFADEGSNDPQVRAKILSIVDYLASIQEK
jgi:mono/diheme cytochrome c family protein